MIYGGKNLSQNLHLIAWKPKIIIFEEDFKMAAKKLKEFGRFHRMK